MEVSLPALSRSGNAARPTPVVGTATAMKTPRLRLLRGNCDGLVTGAKEGDKTAAAARLLHALLMVFSRKFAFVR
jgi:hypothetical protein